MNPIKKFREIRTEKEQRERDDTARDLRILRNFHNYSGVVYEEDYRGKQEGQLRHPDDK